MACFIHQRNFVFKIKKTMECFKKIEVEQGCVPTLKERNNVNSKQFC